MQSIPAVAVPAAHFCRTASPLIGSWRIQMATRALCGGHCCSLCGHARQPVCQSLQGTVAASLQCSTQEQRKGSQHDLGPDAGDSIFELLKSKHLSTSLRQAPSPQTPPPHTFHFPNVRADLSPCFAAGAPQHWTSDLKPGPLRERFQPVSPPERWAGMLQTEAWQPGPSTSPTAATTAAAYSAAIVGPSAAGWQATSTPAAAAATSGPGASEAPGVSAQHTQLLSEDWEVLRVSDQPILTGGLVEHRSPTLATESTAQPVQVSGDVGC